MISRHKKIYLFAGRRQARRMNARCRKPRCSRRPSRPRSARKARPAPHPPPPCDQPRHRRRIEIGTGTRGDLDERQPGEIRTRELAGDVLPSPTRGAPLELLEAQLEFAVARAERLSQISLFLSIASILLALLVVLMFFRLQSVPKQEEPNVPVITSPTPARASTSQPTPIVLYARPGVAEQPPRARTTPR